MGSAEGILNGGRLLTPSSSSAVVEFSSDGCGEDRSLL